jgi:chemotaxis protein methyltransferase WspC
VLFIGPAEGSLLARLGMRPLGIAQSFAYVRQADPRRPRQTAADHAPVAPPLPKLVRSPAPGEAVDGRPGRCRAA